MAAEHRGHTTPLVDVATCLAACSCGAEHPNPTVEICFAADGCALMAEDVAAFYSDQQVLLISDPETEEAIGRKLRFELDQKGINLSHVLLDSKPVATDHLVEEVQEKCQGMGLVISVGSGTINDIGKFAASNLDLPFWVMPTAPSMNGYTSGIAAIKVKGVKRTLPATPPGKIYAVPEVIHKAPIKLRQAGFCDVLAKVVSDIDWRCESLLVSDSYCELPSSLMAEIESSYSGQPEGIGQGDADAVNGLFQGLLLSGVGMSMTGSSAPASGGEHLLSHFLDMREPITGRVPELHGLQVGMGILLSAACYARLSRLRLADIPSLGAEELFWKTADMIPSVWGQTAPEVAKQFEKKRQILISFDYLVPQYWDQLVHLFSLVKSPQYFSDLFTRVGTPFTLEAFHLGPDEFQLAALNCRAIRDRITVLDFAAHAGVLAQAADDVLQLLG